MDRGNKTCETYWHLGLSQRYVALSFCCVRTITQYSPCFVHCVERPACACWPAAHIYSFVTASFEVIVSFLCIGDQSSFVRSFVRSFVHFVLFVGGCSIMAEEVEDTGINVILIDNGEA